MINSERKYEVTCLQCGESDILTIDEHNHVVTITEKIMLTPFVSFRFRRDGNWGFMCSCGNDNRLAKEESNDFKKLVAGDPLSVKRIAQSLSIPDKDQFKMVTL